MKRIQNDLQLETFIREIHSREGQLDRLFANEQPHQLITALSIIEDASRKAQWRVLDLLRGK